MSHLMNSMTENDGAAKPTESGETDHGSAEANVAVPPAEENGLGVAAVNREDPPVDGDESAAADGEAQTADDESDEEVIEEEYYEEEEYEEEEIIEEIVDEGDDDAGETQDGSQMADSSTAGPPSASDTAPSGGSSAQHQPDPEGFTDFADFPPLSDDDESLERPPRQPAGFAESGPGETLSPSGEDIENQKPTAQFTPSIRPTPTTTYAREAPEPDKEPIQPSPFWYWLVFVLICALLGVGAYVGWFLVNKDRVDAPSLGEDDEITRAPTPSPTIGETTAFDPIQGNCDFRDLENPHVIDQCNCVGEIQIIADDVRARYESRLENFIPTIYENFDEEINSCSARNQALVWICSGNEYEYSYDERLDRFALATLYAGLNGNDWNRNDGWLSDASACDWEGIKCDDDGMVQTVALSRNNMEGMLPPEVGLLANMLEFYAAENVLEGPIPEALFFVEDLENVDLGFNAFTGPIPPAIGMAKNLKGLLLEENRLSGRISQELAGAENLQVLNVGSNNLVGSLPSMLFDLESLEMLDLGGNDLTGTISSSISNFQNLTSLTLGPNGFRGDLPSAIAELTKLEYLIVRTIPELGGRLPAAFGRNLKQLLELTITQTKINGNIETDFGDLPNLIRLDLSQNQLRGTIPLELGNLGNLTILDLGGNFLQGAIPVSLGNLGNLTRLSLNDNVLRDGVPNEFAMLENLQFMRLDGTLLTGRVSQEVCDLRDLDLDDFIVDCPSVGSDGVQVGVVCDIPSCCTSCRTVFG